MFPITPPTVPDGLRISDLVGISRLLTVPTRHLAAALSEVPDDLRLGAAGRLRMISPFASTGPATDRYRARARLYGRGPRLIPYARVELEIMPWSRQASELRILPESRSPHAWGLRRLRRYLALSQLAADELQQRIGRAIGAATDPPAVARDTSEAASQPAAA